MEAKRGEAMNRALSVLAAVVILLPVASAVGDDHLAGPAQVSGALAAAREAHGRDLARIEGLLSGPQAARAATLAHADLAQVRLAVAALGDDELRDLAARAQALGADPVAGNLDPDIRQLLIIFLIVAIVILVFQAVD